MASDSKKKRERSANYTEYEREVFTEIIKDFKSVIENVKTDGVTVEKKNRAWNDIENQYNRSDSQIRPRSAQQLKRLYENMKRTKKLYSPNNLLRNNQRLSCYKPKDNLIDYRFLEVVCDHIMEPTKVVVKDDNNSETEADNDTSIGDTNMNTQLCSTDIIYENIEQVQNTNGEHLCSVKVNINNNSNGILQSPNSTLDDCNTTHVRCETNKSRGEELPRYIQKSNIKEEQSSHETVENNIKDCCLKKKHNRHCVTKGTERILGLFETKTSGLIQNESSYVSNVYKLKCELLEIKKQNAILKQLYLKKKNKLIDQKLLENEIDFDD